MESPARIDCQMVLSCRWNTIELQAAWHLFCKVLRGSAEFVSIPGKPFAPLISVKKSPLHSWKVERKLVTEQWHRFSFLSKTGLEGKSRKYGASGVASWMISESKLLFAVGSQVCNRKQPQGRRGWGLLGVCRFKRDERRVQILYAVQVITTLNLLRISCPWKVCIFRKLFTQE